MSDDKMRAEFETYAEQHNWNVRKYHGSYYWAEAARAWQVWQAAYQAGREAERETIFIEWENGEILAAEVERLRAELAAAKAASVVPEESVIWLLAVAAKLEKDGESSGLDSMTKAANWLRDRMNERGEG